MPIVYACIVPHSPVLLPTVGKEHLSKIGATLVALEHIHAQLNRAKPDTIIVLASQDEAKPRKQFRIHLAQKYTAEFSRFGDLSTSLSFDSDPVLADRIKNECIAAGFPTLYTGDEALDYSASVPLVYLLKGVHAKIIVINPAESSRLQKQFECGKTLQKTLQESPKRIAVIAAGDLSHEKESSVAAKIFEQEFMTLLKLEKTKKILALHLHTLHQAGACGIPAFAFLFGVIENMHTHQHIISCESPLGVGHLVAEYTI